jgi:hypothetical protein
VLTHDGVEHISTKSALKHLDKIYGDHLLRVGRALANRSYTEVTDFIDSHLDDFIIMTVIKDDMRVVNADPEDDDA